MMDFNGLKPPQVVGVTLTKQEIRLLRHALQQFIRMEENMKSSRKASPAYYDLQEKFNNIRWDK